MRKNNAASVLAAVSATVMMIGTPAFAADGSVGRALSASRAVGGTSENVKANRVERAVAAAAARCFRDRDLDEWTGRPSDLDRDEAAHCRY